MQIEQIKTFANHIEDVSRKYNKLIISGDANLCTNNLLEKTCVSDAIRLWNLAPLNVKKCATLYQLKKTTKTFVKTLPI